MSFITQIVLIVDDEPKIIELMRDFLEAENFQVETAMDGGSALVVLENKAIDCLLLDVMLPNMDGFELCRRVREKWDLPILFLSARDEDYDKIRALGLGGDDYIVKSATPSEVVARVKAVLRRYKKPNTFATKTLLNFGRLILDLRAHRVMVDGQVVNLTTREFELLQLLAEHPDQVLTRDQLLEYFWENTGDVHNVTVYIRRLREKIELDPNRPEFIVTVWGTGYRFEGKKQ